MFDGGTEAALVAFVVVLILVAAWTIPLYLGTRKDRE